jgi:hypothetical protein
MSVCHSNRFSFSTFTSHSKLKKWWCLKAGGLCTYLIDLRDWGWIERTQVLPLRMTARTLSSFVPYRLPSYSPNSRYFPVPKCMISVLQGT